MQIKNMKLFLLLAAIAAVTLACDGNTELRWKKDTGDNFTKVDSIVWKGSTSDVEWENEELEYDGDKTTFKEIDDDNRQGVGAAAIGGSVAPIVWDNNDRTAIRLSKGQSQEYDIKKVTKK